MGTALILGAGSTDVPVTEGAGAGLSPSDYAHGEALDTVPEDAVPPPHLLLPVDARTCNDVTGGAMPSDLGRRRARVRDATRR
jgi:hypothetical protein